MRCLISEWFICTVEEALKMILLSVLVVLIKEMFCYRAYGTKKVIQKPEGLEPIRVIQSAEFDLQMYIVDVEEETSNALFPLLLQSLKSLPELVIEKGSEKYRIRPFEFVEVTSEEGRRSLGAFHDISNGNNEIAITYNNTWRRKEGAEVCTKSTIIFSSSKEGTKIESIYSGWSETCVFRVSHPSLSVKCKKKNILLYFDKKRKVGDGRNGGDCDSKTSRKDHTKGRSIKFGNSRGFGGSSTDLRSELEIEGEIKIFHNPEYSCGDERGEEIIEENEDRSDRKVKSSRDQNEGDDNIGISDYFDETQEYKAEEL